MTGPRTNLIRPVLRLLPLRLSIWWAWRRMFIGSMKRGTERRQLKDYVIARCRELGLKPDDDNQADAIGILAHTLQIEGIDAPWAVNRFVTTALGRVA